MIFSKEKYELMKNLVELSISNNKELTPIQAIEIGVDFNAMSSLFGQMFIKNLKKDIKKLSEHKVESIHKRVLSGESLLDISREYNFGPLKFAKIYIEHKYGKSFQFSNIIFNPSMIEDCSLREDILSMIESDPLSSHEIEQVKECLGREYEEMLINLLNEKNMCFETESDLRKRGKPKTPDILFLIPMATPIDGKKQTYKNNLDFSLELVDKSFNSETNINQITDIDQSFDEKSRSNENLVINWIDSKAMFADCETFKEHLDQFRAYNNRYGRGLVIYWHGFVESILDLINDDLIIVRESFPEEWIFPSGDIADGRPTHFD